MIPPDAKKTIADPSPANAFPIERRCRRDEALFHPDLLADEPNDAVLHRLDPTKTRTSNNAIMGNALEGAMAVSKAKNMAAEVGLSLPGDDSVQDDAKIAAKVARQQEMLKQRQQERAVQDAELEKRKKERAARKKELEKARGFR